MTNYLKLDEKVWDKKRKVGLQLTIPFIYHFYNQVLNYFVRNNVIKVHKNAANMFSEPNFWSSIRLQNICIFFFIIISKCQHLSETNITMGLLNFKY